MPGRPTRELIAFSKLFIPIALVVAGLTAGAIIPQQRAHLSNLKDTEQRVISQERQILETAIAAYVSDVEFLAASTARHLEARLFAPAFAANLEYQFVNFARGRTVYDQVRFLDATGQERIRVNMSARGPALVPVAMLQNKNKRPYFSRAMQENGGVIISQLDLNIEHGEVEHPFRPVLRFSKAVLDDEGNILGVVVLNFRGQLLLDSLRNMSVTSQGRLYLLNPAGYWLIGPSTDAEWGFMFEPKKAAGFFLSFPREWQTISSKRSGQFTTDKGLFTFDTVSPLPKASRMGTRVMHGFAKEEWTIVSYAPTRLLVPQWHEEAVWLALITLIVLGAVSRLWAVSHVCRQEAE